MTDSLIFDTTNATAGAGAQAVEAATAEAGAGAAEAAEAATNFPFSVYTLGSGSSGNCVYFACRLPSGKVEFLIDAGLSMRATEKALNALGSSLADIAAIFITHEHVDHIGGLAMIAKHYAMPIYIAADSLPFLPSDLPRARLAPVDIPFSLSLGEVQISSFATSHDSFSSCGYRVEAAGYRVGLCTDTGDVLESMATGLYGCQAVILEANYDKAMLETGRYPPFLRERIAGKRGHLDNDTAGRFAAYLVSSGTYRILLAHLSAENNTPDKALAAVRAALALTFPDRPVSLAVAARYGVTKFL